ncbi:MAG: MaoC/PaaZ C-terminal domain-containing protein [bacterium]
MSDINTVNPGDPTPEQKNKVGKYLPIYYAGASGDFNPIHIDPEFGKMVGLGGNILQGLCTMGFVAKMHTDWAQDPGRLKRLKVRFSKPVLPNDTVVVKGTVKEKGGGALRCEVWAENQKGEAVITNGESEIEI